MKIYFRRNSICSFNGGQSLRNGLSSPSRSKYSQIDQSAPVNLAVSQSMSDNGSHSQSNNGLSLSHKQNDVASLTAAAKPSSLESEQDAISSSIASLYQHKLAYCPPDATTPLYYSNFYGRPPTSSVYGYVYYYNFFFLVSNSFTSSLSITIEHIHCMRHLHIHHMH